MKIAIITLPLHFNYGGILQNYALQKVLKDLGNDAVTLEWEISTEVSFKQLIKRYIKKILFPNNFLVSPRKDRNFVIKKIKSFSDKHIDFFPVKNNDLSKLQKTDFDAYIVGGDQIWRNTYWNSVIPLSYDCTYLKFTQNWNVKRLAYAVSFGVKEWTYNQKETEDCCLLAKSFDAISVREDSAVENCKQYLHVNAEQVLDPTLLLSANDYIHLFENDDSLQSHKGCLLKYVLDENSNINQAIEKFSKQKNLSVFSVNNPNIFNYRKTLKERTQYPVEMWLKGFYDASCIITDSFHACVFSIIFNKDFYVIGNKERGLSRIESLLNQFHLENRLISLDELTTIKLTSIDYIEVNKIWEEEKIKSFDFLNNNIN